MCTYGNEGSTQAQEEHSRWKGGTVRGVAARRARYAWLFLFRVSRSLARDRTGRAAC